MSTRGCGYLASLVLVCHLAGGCDPVRTTVQPVRLRVIDATSGKPAAFASVALKLDHLTPRPQRDEVEVRDPWFHGVTAGNGYADIFVEYTALDRSRGETPPARRDWVTGRRYFVRVESGQSSDEEELNVPMTPGVTVKGNLFTVSVIRIQKPQYAEPQPR